MKIFSEKRRFLAVFLCIAALLSIFTLSAAAAPETTAAEITAAEDTTAAEKATEAEKTTAAENTTAAAEEKGAVAAYFEKLKNDIYRVLIKDQRYKHITNGLLITLEITLASLLIGLFIGLVVAIIRSTYEKNGTLKFLNALCKLYLTLFRGTPVIVQLLIIYFLWLGKAGWEETYVAMIAFGLNSGAYVAEIIRSGIMSIDNGQFEAGRSLGFNYVQTMVTVILPQALKNVLPALANEFITLLKETSVASFIAVKDMMKGANVIVGITYNMNIPYITVALIYLVLVVILTKLVALLERRLRSSEH